MPVKFFKYILRTIYVILSLILALAAALYLFEKLISRASLSAAGCQGYESEFDTIPFAKNALEALTSRHDAYTLSNFHQAFCTEIRQAERLFLDFTPIFANFLCKLHSQTLPE